MKTCKAINYVDYNWFADPQIDLAENCPEDLLEPGCFLADANGFDYDVAIVNSDVAVADACKNSSAERFIIGTFHTDISDLPQYQSDPTYFKKVFFN